MWGLRTSSSTLFALLLASILCCFFSPCNSTEDNVTVFSSTSSNETYESSSTSSTSVSETRTGDIAWNSTNSVQPQGKNLWCGKSSPATHSGTSSAPKLLSKPMLNLQCTPKLKPYLETDNPEMGGFIVDAGLTYYPVEGAVAISDQVKQLQIIFINTNTSRAITAGIVEVNTLGNIFSFPLSSLGKASGNPYQVLCQAYAKDEYLTEISVPLAYLPNSDGRQQAVRMNAESGILQVTNQNGTLDSLFTFGFAIDYNKLYSASQFTQVLNYLKELKVNTIQLILSPQSVSDTSRLDQVLSSLGEAGFWVQFDMRNFYSNSNLVVSNIKVAKQHPNVLLYHTAMEPDGQTIQLDVIRETDQTIEQNDSYRPISSTLSCEDYYFSNYSNGNDVVLTNPFVIGASNEKGYSQNQTTYNPIFGSSTCDGCKGSFVDLVNRIRIFRNRRHLLGRDRTMQLWAVPQAVSASSDLNQVPTGEQFLLMSTIYIIEGVVGLTTWDNKMDLSQDLKRATQIMGDSLPLIANYLERPQSFLPIPPVNSYPSDKFIANIWFDQINQSMLVMVANLVGEEVSWEIDSPYSNSTSTFETNWVYVSKNSTVPHLTQHENKISFKSKLQGYGFGAWTIKAKSSGNASIQSFGDVDRMLSP